MAYKSEDDALAQNSNWRNGSQDVESTDGELD
jgi:hypothetical protein